MTTALRGPQLARLLGHWHALPGRRRSPEYAALASAIRGLLADGRLPLGVRLPAERELADELRISRTTVSAAYRALRESGHLTSRRGAGSWTTLPAGHRVDTSGLWSAPDSPDVIDMGSAVLAAPPQLLDAARLAVDDLARYAGSAGYHPAGIRELREEVAAGYAARGLPTSPEQIMVTSGVLHALDLVIRLIVAPGQPVLVESPTYPNALAGLNGRRARIVTYGLPQTGWDPDLLLATLRAARPRLAYVIPEFQNPTGHLMPADLRASLVAAAHANGTDLVVDESFVDLPLPAPAGAAASLPPVSAGAAASLPPVSAGAAASLPPPLASYDRHARVLSIGGMSKPYWGGLRVGWIRAPAPVVQRLAAIRVGMDMASPVLEQLVAVRLLRQADDIVPVRRAELAARRDALMAALRTELPSWQFAVPAGGVSLWAELDAPVSSALARAVEDFGVRLAPGPRFGVDGTLERFLRLPFTLPAGDLVEAVRRIAAARYDIDRSHRPSWSEPAIIA